MGKRKERRLAAMSAANRRVKLDLFAEPSEGMMGTAAHEEVGVDPDEDHNAGVPTSPSSSGHKPENPLLLLGQYSDDDDDLDEEASKRAKHDADGSSSVPVDGQTQEPRQVGEGDAENEIANGDIKQESDQAETAKKHDHNTNKENDGNVPVKHSESNTEIHTSNSEPTGVLIDGDLAGGWKVVMHESNQYYYWNTMTGETSWEVPPILSGDEAVPSGSEANGSHMDLHMCTNLNTETTAYAHASVDELGRSNLTSKDLGEYSNISGIHNETGEAQLAYDGSQKISHIASVECIQYVNPSAPSNFNSSLQTNGVTGEQRTIPGTEHQGELNECNQKDVHSARLVEYSESLLRKMENLHRSGHQLEGHELVMKEIEIRLSDCKALSSYGSSLLPFWWHSEAQLKQLEFIISSRELYLLAQSTNNHNTEVAQNSSLKDECSLQITGAESEADQTDKDNYSPSSLNATKIQMDEISRRLEGEDVTETHHSFGSEQEPENVVATDSNATSGQLVTVVDPHSEEDMDMDVEMEVDDDIPAGNVHISESSTPPELLNHPHLLPVECPPLPLDESSIPPPPEEEWIPPPPPDSEPVPPPPPEEPLAPSFPPPYPHTLPYAPYPDHYSMGYNVPAVEYYASTAGDIASVNYYAQVEASHVTQSHPPTYYESVVATALPEGTAAGSPIELVAYYDISSVPVPSGSAISSTQPSAYYLESGPVCYHGNVPALDHTGTANITGTYETNSVPGRNMEPVTSAVVTESQASNLQVASVPATVAQPVGDSLFNGTDAVPIVPSKSQTKVVRRKKHTIAVAPTLRSNKKVSSLVEKWKAAKEELHDDDDDDEEPENAYEVMEKKRQKKIEEWRARQIATGEAQDNANFLPLGGDWRERVKHKKAEAKKEADRTPAEVVDNDEGKQPDLEELSKDLPSGWQAYWDESTKEIYYGNTITSQTTWTRPTI